MMPEIFAHLFGDWVCQPRWLFDRKNKHLALMGLHGFIVALPFLVITTDPLRLMGIAVAHAVIDWFRVGGKIAALLGFRFHDGSDRNLVWAWIIVVDQFLHLTCNHIILR